MCVCVGAGRDHREIMCMHAQMCVRVHEWESNFISYCWKFTLCFFFFFVVIKCLALSFWPKIVNKLLNNLLNWSSWFVHSRNSLISVIPDVPLVPHSSLYNKLPLSSQTLFNIWYILSSRGCGNENIDHNKEEKQEESDRCLTKTPRYNNRDV